MKDLNDGIQHTRSTIAQGPGLVEHVELRNLLTEIWNIQKWYTSGIGMARFHDEAYCMDCLLVAQTRTCIVFNTC